MSPENDIYASIEDLPLVQDSKLDSTPEEVNPDSGESSPVNIRTS